jgi:hypothetical protein
MTAQSMPSDARFRATGHTEQLSSIFSQYLDDHDRKGTRMSNSRNAFTSRLHRLGVVGPAGVCAFGGSGAPKTSRGSGAPLRRRAFVTLATLAALVFSAAPALAAAPEDPLTGKAEPVTATTAVLHGVLNPLNAGQPGSYQFDYAPAETGGCIGNDVAPASPALAMGAEGEAEEVTVTGLESNKEYLFCVVAFSLSAERADGAAVSFKTLPLKPTVDSEAAAGVSSTAATLEAQVDPNNESTAFTFEYSTQGKTGPGEKLEGTIVKVIGENPIGGGSAQTVSVPRLEGLAPGASYFYRVVSKNVTGTTEGPVKEFATVPTPTTKPVTAITATTVTFHGELTPLNSLVETEYAFDYGIGTENCRGGSATTPEDAGIAPPATKTVSTAVTGLQPNVTYSVCLVSLDKFGSGEVGSEIDPHTPQVQFSTPAAPPEIKAGSEKASGLTPYEATLEAQVNPNNQATTYTFEYSTTESGGALTGTIVTLKGAGPIGGYGYQTVGVPTGHVLTPGATYHLRVIAENTTGKVEGAGEFTAQTVKAPEIISEAFSGLTAEKAKLEATVNPDYQETSCEFEYGTESSLATHTTVPCPASLGDGGSGVGASVELAGLEPSTPYYFRVLATNGTGTTTDPTIEEFKTLAAQAPTVEAAFTSDVASTSATLNASVNPGALATTYTFEYAPQGATFTPVAEAEGTGILPEGDSPVGVSVHVQNGLLPGTSYEFRVTAHNSAATVTGTTASFTTLPPSGGGYALPDNRQWEMVSPPDKHGALIEPITQEDVIEASTEGSAIAYPASAPTEDQPQGNPDMVQILSKRSADGWSSQDIAVPVEESVTGPVAGYGHQYQFFSSDLLRALIEPRADIQVGAATTFPGEETAPYATEQTPFLRENFACPSATCYTPILTTTDVTSGAKYGEGAHLGGYSGPRGAADKSPLEGATPDLSHVVLAVSAPLTKATPNAPAAAGEAGLYEWSADKPPAEQLQLVSVLPASEGGGLPSSFSVLGRHDGNGAETRHAISNDGSLIVWTAAYEGAGALYMRDTVRGETVRISGGQANFTDASSDDSKVFFTEGEDLYVFEVTSGESEPLAGTTTRLTEGAGVSGSVLAASEDGSFVYFVANGVLGDGAGHGATAGNCGPLTGEMCNLYVEHYNGGVWEAPRFIAALSGADSVDWEYGSLNEHTSGSSPDGRYLAFMSDQDLTGYDTADAVSGEPAEEVYLYHAEVSSSGQLEPGKLVCASCNPTGARPDGERSEHENMRFVAGYDVWRQGHWLSANIPGWVTYEDRRGVHQPRYLSDSGRLFFNSHEALVPQDVNDTWDVYEYEPPGKGGEGEGNCTTSTQSASYLYNPKAEGCVGLISSGESPEESAFFDASESGGDVFFATLSQLVPQDLDHAMDVYDAHECTAKAPCFPAAAETPPPCTTEASCRPSPKPQPSIYGPPASATFAGPGNLAQSPPPAPVKVTKKKTVKCKKGLVKNKKGKCVKKSKSKKKAKKSSDDRRAK